MNKKDVGWKGAFVVSVTPFKENGTISIKDFEEIIDFYLNAGIYGFIIAGHNSECWNLDANELEILTKVAIRKINKKIPVIVGIERVTAQEIVDIAKICVDAGADGIMVEPPYIITTSTEEEIVRRYEEINEGIDIPIMLYNNPRRTNINLAPSTVRKLAEIDNVVAVKESTGNFRQVTELVQHCGDRLSIFPGPGELIFPGFLIGTDGFITSGAVELFGKEGVRLYESSIHGDYETTKKIHFKVAKVYDLLFGLGTWPAAMKQAMNIMGIPAGYPRKPVLPLTNKENETLRQNMKQLGLIE
jgi:4-hydroxy-tetrahydrodipicolinate synthase